MLGGSLVSESCVCIGDNESGMWHDAGLQRRVLYNDVLIISVSSCVRFSRFFFFSPPKLAPVETMPEEKHCTNSALTSDDDEQKNAFPLVMCPWRT